jgi:recombinase
MPREARAPTTGERRHVAGGLLSVGPLAHLLKNRFYIGEVAYRGEVHKGEHEPILDVELFERRTPSGSVSRTYHPLPFLSLTASNFALSACSAMMVI